MAATTNRASMSKREGGFNLKSETLPFYIIEFHTVASKMVVKLAKNNDSRQFIEHIIHQDSPAMDFSTFCKYSNMFKDYEEWKFGSKDSPLSKSQPKQKDAGGKDATNSGKINTLTKQAVMKGKNLVSHSTLQCTAVLYSAEGRTEYVQSMNHGPIAIRLTDLERGGKAVEVVLPDGSQRKLAIRSDKDKSKMKVMNGSTRSEGMIQLEINQSLYIFMFHNSKESKQFLLELGVEQSLEANDVIQYRAIFKAGRESSSLYVETAKPQSRDTVSSRTRNGTTETLTPILQKSDSNSSHPKQKPLKPPSKPIETVPSPPPPPSSPPKSVALIYPAKGMNLVTLHAEDIDRLKEGEFLNDSLIEFYIRWTTNTYATKTNDTFHIFNTFFYQSLSTREDGTIGRVSIPETFTKVKRWTKTINIFPSGFLWFPLMNVCTGIWL
ncbi:hypothetical protein BCR33DRAFT_115280 [Rhizoclosmatium globosum]|uniref:Ubiquitin-like protease family profile domain-containing protein n=1 Tax=Rhizoclosmatium globosum TaxID=329046 RepID=A0A1Y2CJK1_9FUNG|nr:hypothetical protein BCR33DRAFT_115280 [Rhizoclosmatium globosum]|eukprot:ORY47024.1 hypothetical protein BCR33DRAFT_115280 [Rhizoclosmatium globosum]